MEIPKTRGVTVSGTLRAMSGTPFTIQDDTLDSDRNRINFAPLPAGTYQPLPAAGEFVMNDVESIGGRNGARGPGFVQIDMRIGYRARLGGRRTLDIFYETFNVSRPGEFHEPGRQSSTDSGLSAVGRPAGRHGLPAAVSARTSARVLDSLAAVREGRGMRAEG